ncbi:MAG: hypothetical protein FWE42_07080 [Defluviitaleaceae bacterium]|nr:hypothetical protein [Defluviitaleaceae bacterium]
MKNIIPLGVKIKQIRVFKGFSQESIANSIDSTVMRVSRIERGQTECDKATLNAIKKALEIENAPLTEHELEVYKSRLWVWYETINIKGVPEARDMQNDLFPITALPFIDEIAMLYSMIETRILSLEGDILAAEERLDAAKAYVSEANNDVSNELKFLYIRNKGFVYNAHGQYEKALVLYMKLLELERNVIKPGPDILSGIGFLHCNMGRPFCAIWYFEKALSGLKDDFISIRKSDIGISLGECYMMVGGITKAKALLETSLTHARSLNNKASIGRALSSLGYLYTLTESYDKALKYCGDALEYLQDNTELYITALYNKANCLQKMKEFERCADVLTEGKTLAEGNEGLVILLETVNHVMNIKDDGAADFLENEAIPFLRKGVHRHIALHICEMLEQYYKKRGAQRKALLIAVTSRDIMKEMAYGDCWI